MTDINQNVSTAVTIGPIVDPVSALGDTGLVLTSADEVYVIKHDGGAEVNINSFTLSALTVDGSYRLHLRASVVDTLGMMTVHIRDDSLMLPYAHVFNIVHSGYYNMKYGSSNLNCNVAAMDANVITAAAINADAITSAKIAAGAIDKDDQLIGLNDLTAAQVNTQCDQALIDINLDHLMAVAAADSDITTSSVIGYLASDNANWTGFDHTTDSLEALRNNQWGAAARTLTAFAFENTISAINANVITATAINADAITSAKIAAGAIDKGDQLIGLNDLSEAQVNAQVDTALTDINLDHLLAVSALDADVVASSVMAQIAASDGAWSGFDLTADSLEAIRDRGDAAWITGGGGGITDILNIVPLIPNDIDLANTASYRLGLMLVNSLDDLPTTAEIDPGIINIHHKAIGATGWTLIVSAACLELAGLVYYDEVFDSASTYAEGDSIRVTFKDQKITVAANDYEISDSTGRFFYTSIRQTMRGTDNALLSANANIISAVVASAMRDIKLHELINSAASDAANNAFISRIAASDGDWSGFDNTADSLEALRDRGDAAWVTNTLTIANISTAVASAMRDIRLHQLISNSAAASHVITDSIIGLIAGSGGTFSTYAAGTDSLEAIRNRGDTAWVAAGSMADVRSTVSAGVASALRDIKLHELINSAASDATDDSFIAHIAAVSGNWSDFDDTTDSLEALAGTTAVPASTVASATWAYATRALTDKTNFNASNFNATSIWNEATRTLTANTNLNDPTAATIASNVWAYSAVTPGAGTMGHQMVNDVDAILADTGTDGVVIANDGITAAKIAANAIGASELATDAVNEIVDAVWAKVLESQGSHTAQDIAQVTLAALAGVTASGGATLKTPDGVANRIQATINASDERTAITLTT